MKNVYQTPLAELVFIDVKDIVVCSLGKIELVDDVYADASDLFGDEIIQ